MVMVAESVSYFAPLPKRMEGPWLVDNDGGLLVKLDRSVGRSNCSGLRRGQARGPKSQVSFVGNLSDSTADRALAIARKTGRPFIEVHYELSAGRVLAEMQEREHIERTRSRA